MGLLRRNRALMEVELAGSSRRRYFSPAALSLYEDLRGPLRAIPGGRVLDVGAGTSPSRREAIRADRYLALDLDPSLRGIDIAGDARSLPIKGATVDVVVCSQVLEHVPEPAEILAEIGRVLRPGGRLIVSVPFLARVHDAPHDYFRFTEFGLVSLLRGAGFEPTRVTPSGSLACFVGHQLSTVLVGGTWHLRSIRDLVFWLNAAVVVVPCDLLDRALRLGRRMPLNLVAVAVKPAASTS